jgi:hypothetical protein
MRKFANLLRNSADVSAWYASLNEDATEGLFRCPIDLARQVFMYMDSFGVWPDPRPGACYKKEDAHAVILECNLMSGMLERLINAIRTIEVVQRKGEHDVPHSREVRCSGENLEARSVAFIDSLLSAPQNVPPDVMWSSEDRIAALDFVYLELLKRNEQFKKPISPAGALLSSLLFGEARAARAQWLLLQLQTKRTKISN